MLFKKNFLPCPTMMGKIQYQFGGYFCQENSGSTFEKLNHTLYKLYRLLRSFISYKKYYNLYFYFQLCYFHAVLSILICYIRKFYLFEALLGFYMTKLRYTNLSLKTVYLLNLYLILLTHDYISQQNFHVPILSPLTINKYTVKDSFAFGKEITKTDCKYAMASLDVENLFTNIPLEETIENCINDSFFEKSKIDDLT